MNLEKYLERLSELLDLEAQASIRSYREDMEKKSLSERRQKGITWYPVNISEQSFGFGGKLYLALEKPQHAGSEHITDSGKNRRNGSGQHRFQVGDPVGVSEYDKGKPINTLQGTITSVWNDRMRVAFSAEEMPDWMDGATLGIDRLFDEVTFREMRYALKKLREEPNPRQKSILSTLLGLQQQYLHTQIQDDVAPSLNESQQAAVKYVLQAEDAAIIHGPPGTGKTTTLVQAIKQTLNREKQVLVCAPSNTAVDLLTERLAQKGIKVLRIGNPARVSTELLEYTAEGQISKHPEFKRLKKLRKEADEYRRLSGQYKRNFGKEERNQRRLLRQEAKRIRKEVEQLEDYIVDSTIGEAQVVTATLVGASSKYLRGKHFSTAFIDEAGQALAPACLIPLVRADRLILAGDHCQLPPTVKSPDASKQGLEVTLLEAAVAQQPSLSTLLDTQYRMNEQIMQFSSEQFYEGKLKADASVAQHTLFEGLPPVSFIDTAGRGFEEGREGEKGSYFNEGEAELVFKHWEETLQMWPPESKPTDGNADQTAISLGIISPYRAQVNHLNDLLPKQAAGIHIRVQSVDGFQGQEQDVIYVSLVRSNEEGNIGFLKDTRRMNVALTRARKSLVVIGDSATLGQHPFYQEFLAYIDRIGAYRSAWEFG